MSTSKTIECVYERGVLKPLHEVDFREGERLKLTIKRFNISDFLGAFGEGSIEEFEEFEEENGETKSVNLKELYIKKILNIKPNK